MSSIIRKYQDRQRSPFLTLGKSKTKQSFKAECDINTILKNYKKTGLLSHVSQYQGKYEDLSQPTDYQTALNLVIDAQLAFDTLPSQIRKQFQNDPAQFLNFVDNPENEDKMIEMGLLPPKTLAQPIEPATSAQTVETETPQA